MKKFWLLALVALLVVALVACGGPADTTNGTPDESTTEPAGTTTPNNNNDTTPPDDGGDDDEPLYPGIDILNGDLDNAAVTPNWQGIDACAFEEHKALDFRVALVFHMDETVNGIYEDLIYTTDATLPNDQNWELNPEYRWEVTIDGEVIPITNFSILNDQTTGYIRMDLNGWTYSTEVDQYGYHEYDCLLKIYNSDNDIAYWAWFTDPDWNGAYVFAVPEPLVMVPDPDRPATHVAISNVKYAEGISGPDGFNNDELYYNLFDDTVRAKLCSKYNTPIEWMFKFDAPTQIVSYSLVGANDDQDFPERVPMVWTLYGSSDGVNWEVIDEQDLTGSTDPVVNYGERNFVLENPVDYTYFKIQFEYDFAWDDPTATTTWQLSDIVMYTEAE